ncbi:MAG: MucB/RseB C-terminal domain-containing protein [Burkholderiales bacterium]|nr:MucB/RseB C-terminal domain-containing protein [Burkholderiales bacterium]
MKFTRWLVVFVVSALPAGVVLAQSPKARDARPLDAIGWLHWMAKSAAEASFSGTYIHQYGNRMETSRVTHVVDHEGEHEKLETLDGAPWEIIRKNDEIICYIPDVKVIKLDRKRARKFFPALLTNVADVMENYSAKLGGMDRVAGFDCQMVVLEPKDSFRFGHRFCVDVASGLMLRATMVSEKKEIIEQFVFTQLMIGSQVPRELLKSAYADKKAGWQTDKSALQDGLRTDSGWYAGSLPPGFKKILEVRRKMSGKTGPVIQQIYSDGLASVSVFIENAEPGEKPQTGLIQQGNYSLYARPVPDQPFNIKVFGEVPRASLQQIGNSLASRSR